MKEGLALEVGGARDSVAGTEGVEAALRECVGVMEVMGVEVGVEEAQGEAVGESVGGAVKVRPLLGVLPGSAPLAGEGDTVVQAEGVAEGQEDREPVEVRETVKLTEGEPLGVLTGVLLRQEVKECVLVEEREGEREEEVVAEALPMPPPPPAPPPPPPAVTVGREVRVTVEEREPLAVAVTDTVVESVTCCGVGETGALAETVGVAVAQGVEEPVRGAEAVRAALAEAWPGVGEAGEEGDIVEEGESVACRRSEGVGVLVGAGVCVPCAAPRDGVGAREGEVEAQAVCVGVIMGVREGKGVRLGEGETLGEPVELGLPRGEGVPEMVKVCVGVAVVQVLVVNVPRAPVKDTVSEVD